MGWDGMVFGVMLGIDRMRWDWIDWCVLFLLREMFKFTLSSLWPPCADSISCSSNYSLWLLLPSMPLCCELTSVTLSCLSALRTYTQTLPPSFLKTRQPYSINPPYFFVTPYHLNFLRYHLELVLFMLLRLIRAPLPDYFHWREVVLWSCFISVACFLISLQWGKG